MLGLMQDWPLLCHRIIDHAAINHGDPLIKASRTNAVTRQLAELAAVLSPKQEDNRSLLGRLFRRA